MITAKCTLQYITFWELFAEENGYEFHDFNISANNFLHNFSYFSDDV